MFRRYLDLETGQPLAAWRRGVPVQIELWITTAGQGPQLVLLEDPLPPATEVLEIASEDAASLLWRRTEDDRFRAALRIDAPGIHRLRYTVLARAPGEFRVPGTTIRTLYGAPAKARTAVARLVVE
jgi:uncharacterized protein YfaS (alpha-2-macroglobulin family)